MKTIEHSYKENKITFVLGYNSVVKVNANEMAKIFDKDFEEYIKLKSTQDFIKAYMQSLKGDDDDNIPMPDDLLYSQRKSGTYISDDLAKKFAAWLNPVFEVWILKKIEELKFSHYNAHSKALNAQQQEIVKFEALQRQAVREQNELALSIIESHRKLETFRNDKGNALRKQNKEVKNLFSSIDD